VNTLSVIETAIGWALEIAGDSSHGYDQNNRWGPDYDCSSFVISAYKKAGLPLTATYTGNMKYDFLLNGFVEVTDNTLKRGDVLLHERNHTAMYIGNGQLVHASINEKGTIKGGQVGDQTGGEICVRGYYNYPWDCVLRYVGEEATENATASVLEAVQGAVPTLRQGHTGSAVLSMQLILIHKWAISCGPDGADGDFGPNTDTALRRFQANRGLMADGVCGPKTWAALIGGVN
jgi:cell wall-associated NlpC family hydrolase